MKFYAAASLRSCEIFILFYLFIFYLFKVGKKNIELKVYRRNSFSIKRKS